MTDLILTRVDSWTLATGGFADGQARVRDIELAEHLDYGDPVAIRKLIRSLSENGRLGIVSAVEINRGARGRPGSEFWLTEAQALKVVAKSETAKADSMLDEVIRVFITARHSVPALAPLDQQMRAMFNEMVAPLFETMNTLAKTIQDISGCTISDADWKWLRREVCAIAKLRSMGSAGSKGENSERRIVYNKLGASVAWTGSGRPWRGLPASRVAQAKAALAEMRRDAERMFPPIGERQLSLLQKAN